MVTLQTIHEFASKLNAFTKHLNETKDPADDILRDANELYETAEKIVEEVGYKSIYFDRMSVEYFSFLDGYTDYLYGSDNDNDDEEEYCEDEYESDNDNVNEKVEIDVDLILTIAERYFEGYDIYGPYLKERCGDSDNVYSEVFKDYRNMFNTLLSCYNKKEDFGKAKTFIQKAIDAVECKDPEDDYYLISLYENLGRINWRLGELDDAIEAFETARKMLEYSDDEARDISIACMLWGVYEDKGDYENALKCANTYSNYVQFCDPCSDEASESLVELAELYLKAGDLHFAEFDLERAIRNYDPESGYKPNWLPYAYSVYSKFYAAKGDLDKAKEYLEKAYADYIELFGEDDEITQSVKEQLDQYNTETK